ncbi:MAG TPA: peptide-methionine (S)-S-oxide reductase MsrA [Bacteroidales bacterium]|nr:peptide-methionine (S)-S-oxide reductase MsrA [Bacteroidales bacterium]
METNVRYDTATFGGGCFWCIEAIYEQLKGVKEVVSGYAGGTTENPTYGQVCSGETGHAEVAQILFDPDIISYKELLLIFFSSHDPTTVNRQGADVGTQYRSVIFYHDAHQKNDAEDMIKMLAEQKVYKDPIVTEIASYTVFYPAEKYHQEYYKNNSSQPYCSVVINPKLAKFRKNFEKYLK